MYKNNGPGKRKNHVSPQCLIKQWATIENGRAGVNVYEIPKTKYSFSTAERGKPFSFAIKDFIYVPKINGQRTNVVEDWLGGFESEFATFINNVKDYKEGMSLVKSPKEWDKLLHAIFSLKNRNVHDMKKIRTYLENNPELKEKISINEETDIELLMLQNLIHSTMEDAIEYHICDFLIMHNLSGNIILTDRPLIFEISTEYYILPVTPYHLVAFKKSTERIPTYTTSDFTDQMVESYNNMVATLARDWVVSTKKELLQKYAPNLVAHDESEVPEYEEIKNLTRGYSI